MDISRLRKPVKDIGKDLSKIPDKVMKEPKFDGIWITIMRIGNQVCIMSRNGKRKESLEKMYGIYFRKLKPDQMIMGEAEYGSQWGRERYSYISIIIIDRR